MQTFMTLVYPVDGQGVWLGLKLKRIGVGTRVGFGGRVKEGETLEEAAIRELQEECGLIISVDQLQPVGWLIVHNPHYEAKLGVLRIRVFTISEWEGVPRPSDEMVPDWFALDRLPWDKMRESERYWLPPVLAGCRVKAKILYDEDEQLVNMSVSISKVPSAL